MNSLPILFNISGKRIMIGRVRVCHVGKEGKKDRGALSNVLSKKNHRDELSLAASGIFRICRNSKKLNFEEKRFFFLFSWRDE